MPTRIIAAPATTIHPVAAPGPVNANEFEEARTTGAAVEADPDPGGSLDNDDGFVAGVPVVVDTEPVDPDEPVGEEAVVVELGEADASVEAVTGANGWVVVGPTPGSEGLVVGTGSGGGAPVVAITGDVGEPGGNDDTIPVGSELFG